MSRFDRIARVGVLSILAINALWVLVLPSFPTLDGWPHLHTARLLMDGTLNDVYCPNDGLVPNRFGHLLLGWLQVIFPAMVAERILLATIIWLVGWGTWSLARAFGGSNLLVLLVLPFTWNFLLVMGFHNFLLGVGLALVGAAYWVRAERIDLWHGTLLLLWSLLLLQTHSMALAFFLLITATHEFTVLAGWKMRKRIVFLKKERPASIMYLLACLPATLLLLGYHVGQGAVWDAAEPDKALHDLKELRALLLYSGWDEGKFAYAMKLVLVAGTALVILVRTENFKSLRPVFGHRDMLLFLAVLIFAVHPFVPDSTGFASYITVRLQLMGLLLFIAWLATQPMPWTTAVVPVLLLLMVHQARSRYIAETTRPLSEQRDLVLDAADALPEGSTILPISFERSWVLGHISSLLAVERNVTLLENYECSNDYFPLRWCAALPEYLQRHLGGQDRCLAWLNKHVTSGAWPVIDHIVLIGDEIDGIRCEHAVLVPILETHFERGPDNGYVRIYSRRPSDRVADHIGNWNFAKRLGTSSFAPPKTE